MNDARPGGYKYAGEAACGVLAKVPFRVFRLGVTCNLLPPSPRIFQGTPALRQRYPVFDSLVLVGASGAALVLLAPVGAVFAGSSSLVKSIYEIFS